MWTFWAGKAKTRLTRAEEQIIADTETRPILSRLWGGIRHALWFATVSAQEPIYGLTFLVSLVAFIVAAAGLILEWEVVPEAAALLPAWLREPMQATPLAFLFGALGVTVAAQAFSRIFDLLVDWLDPR